jgi:DNA-binding response OmpR family regulator
MALILIIDDDAAIRNMLRLTLTHAGHTVVEACDGREGLKHLEDFGADLVITDLVMPGKEGLELMMEVRNSHSYVKFIAMSGAGRRESDYLRVAKFLGANQVLSKPFTAEVLLDAVNQVLPSLETLKDK